MTTVRHETVHYTAEEMAAKEAAEKKAKAKKQRTTLIICGAALLISAVCCCGPICRSFTEGMGEGFATGMATVEATRTSNLTRTPRPTPTATIAPASIPTPTSTAVPTPDCLTAGDIERQRNILTDMQRGIYEQEIVGAVICFRGQISEVYPDGDITLDDSSMRWNLVRLQGVPLDVGAMLSKDQLFEGRGVVTEVSNGFLGLGMSIDIWVTSWNN